MRDINPYCDVCYTFQSAVIPMLTFKWEGQDRIARIIFDGYYKNKTSIRREVREGSSVSYWG